MEEEYNKLTRQISNIDFDEYLDEETEPAKPPVEEEPSPVPAKTQKRRRKTESQQDERPLLKVKIYISTEAYKVLRRKQEQHLDETGKFVPIGSLASEAILKG